MRLSALPLLLSSLAFLFILPAAAVFADEAYQVDFHYALLGSPLAQNTFFHRPSTNSKAALIYTLSDKHIIGAVNPKDGSLLWRQRLLEESRNLTTQGLLKAGEGADVVISAIEGVVQAWDAIDGRLVWEHKDEGNVKAVEVVAGINAERDVFVASEVDGVNTRVKRLASDSGEVKWSYEDASGNTPFALVSSGNSHYYLSLHQGLLSSHKIHVSQLNVLSTGKSASQPVQLADAEVGSPESIIYAGNSGGVPLLVWTDKTYRTLKFNVIGSKQVTAVSPSSKAGKSVDSIVAHSLGPSAAHPHVLIHYQSAQSHWAEVYHVQGSKVSKAYDLPVVGGRGAFSVSGLGTEFYFIRHTSLETSLYSSRDATVLSKWNIKSGSSDPVHATSEVVMRAGAKYSLRSAVALPSGDLELFRNGEVLWARPEGLTGIVAAGFVESSGADELLEDLAVESHSSLIGAYIHRLNRHAKQLQYLPDWLRGLSGRMLPSIIRSIDDSDDKASSYPAFGFNKIVLVATAGGRLAALDMGNHGLLLWSVQAVSLPAGETWDVLSIVQDRGGAIVRGARGAFLGVAISTGEILERHPEDGNPALKSFLQTATSQATIESIPVYRDGSLGASTNAALASDVVIVTEGNDNIIRGWTILKGGKRSLIWSFAPTAGQQIQEVQIPPAHDPVASIGKALGDRNVLYKYLNPNIFLVTTIGLEDSTANFHILDSTSGSVIYSARHAGVDTSQSISSTLTENWFSYSFFSESAAAITGPGQAEQKKVRGYQLIVSELYESPFPNDRGPLGNSPNFSTLHPLTADGAEITENPFVISQTFLIPGPIAYMTTTSTLQGITPRSLLCTLPGINALMSIPRYILDPRRPVGRDPTPLEAEEGLFRYNPVLEFEPKWLLSHKRDLLSISKVITTPSKLESTSLLLAYGDVDIFGTRVSPIGSFDMLGKGFSKLQLIGTVAALAIGTSLLAPFVRRKQIDGQWKA